MSEKVKLEKIDKLVPIFDKMIDRRVNKIFDAYCWSEIWKNLKDVRHLGRKRLLSMYRLCFNIVDDHGYRNYSNAPRMYELFFIVCVKHGILYGDRYTIKIRSIFKAVFKLYISEHIDEMRYSNYFKGGIRYINDIDELRKYVMETVEKLLL